MRYILAVLFIAVGYSQMDSTRTTFTSATVPLTKFESEELLPNAATQMCSGSTVSTTRTSGTVLSVGTSSSATLPQSVRLGFLTRQITAAVTATLTAGTGTGTVTVYAFLSGANVLSFGVINPTSNTISCAGCTTASPGSVTGQNIIAIGMPLWTWTITSGAWDVSGGTQKQTGQNCWVDRLEFSNLTAGAVTVTATDSQGTPLQAFPAISLPANGYTLVVWPGGKFFEGGLKLTAGTASAINAGVRGGRILQ